MKILEVKNASNQEINNMIWTPRQCSFKYMDADGNISDIRYGIVMPNMDVITADNGDLFDGDTEVHLIEDEMDNDSVVLVDIFEEWVDFDEAIGEE